MTYLTKEDWTSILVPKFSDDKSFAEHVKQNIKNHNNFIKLISKIITTNTEKKLFQRILISSMIYFQKYIIFNNILESNLSPLDKLILYCTCVFIASKEANRLFNIEKLSKKFQIYFNKFKQFEVEQIQDLIIDKEFEVLLSIEFDISIDWPYGMVNKLKQYLKNVGIGDETIQSFISCINSNINDSILLPLRLYYTPKEIVFSCILLAKKKQKEDFINLNDLIKLSQSDIDKNNIQECSLYISKIIKYKEMLTQSVNNKSNINDKIDNNCFKKQQDNLNVAKIALIKTNTD